MCLRYEQNCSPGKKKNSVGVRKSQCCVIKPHKAIYALHQEEESNYWNLRHSTCQRCWFEFFFFLFAFFFIWEQKWQGVVHYASPHVAKKQRQSTFVLDDNPPTVKVDRGPEQTWNEWLPHCRRVIRLRWKNGKRVSPFYLALRDPSLRSPATRWIQKANQVFSYFYRHNQVKLPHYCCVDSHFERDWSSECGEVVESRPLG